MLSINNSNGSNPVTVVNSSQSKAILTKAQNERINIALKGLKEPPKVTKNETSFGIKAVGWIQKLAPGVVSKGVSLVFTKSDKEFSEVVAKNKENFINELQKLMPVNRKENAQRIIDLLDGYLMPVVKKALPKLGEKVPELQILMNAQSDLVFNIIEANLLKILTNLISRKVKTAEQTPAGQPGSIEDLQKKEDVMLLFTILDQPEFSNAFQRLFFDNSPTSSVADIENIRKDGISLCEELLTNILKTALDPDNIVIEDDQFFDQLDLPINWGLLKKFVKDDLDTSFKTEKELKKHIFDKLMIVADEIAGESNVTRMSFKQQYHEAWNGTSKPLQEASQKLSKTILNAAIEKIPTMKQQIVEQIKGKIDPSIGLNDEWLGKQIDSLTIWFQSSSSTDTLEGLISSLSLNFIKSTVKDAKKGTLIEVLESLTRKFLSLLPSIDDKTDTMQSLEKNYQLRSKVLELEQKSREGLTEKQIASLDKELTKAKANLQNNYNYWVLPQPNGKKGRAVEYIHNLLHKQFDITPENFGISDDKSGGLVNDVKQKVWNFIMNDFLPRYMIDITSDMLHPMSSKDKNEAKIDELTGSTSAVLATRIDTKNLLTFIRNKDAVYRLIPTMINENMDNKISDKQIALDVDKLKGVANSADLNRFWDYIESIIKILIQKIVINTADGKGISQFNEQGTLLYFISKFSGPLIDIFANTITEEDIYRFNKKRDLEKLLISHPNDKKIKDEIVSINKALLNKIKSFIEKTIVVTGITKDDLPIPRFGDLPQIMWDSITKTIIPEMIVEKYSGLVLDIHSNIVQPKKQLPEQEEKLERQTGSAHATVFAKALSEIFVNKFGPAISAKSVDGKTIGDLIKALGLDKIYKDKSESDQRSVISAVDNTGIISNYINNIVCKLFNIAVEKIIDKEKDSKFDVKLVTVFVNLLSSHMKNTDKKTTKKELLNQLRTLLLDLVNIHCQEDLKQFVPIPELIPEIWDLIHSDDPNEGVFPKIADIIDELLADPATVPMILKNIFETTNANLQFNPSDAVSVLEKKKRKTPNDIENIVLLDEQLKGYFKKLSDNDVASAIEIYKAISGKQPIVAWDPETIKKIKAFNPATELPAPIRDEEQTQLQEAVKNLLDVALPFTGLKEFEDQDFFLRILKPTKKINENVELIADTIRSTLGKNFVIDMLNLALARGLPNLSIIEQGKYTYDASGKVTGFIDKNGGRVRVKKLPGEQTVEDQYKIAKEKALNDFENKKLEVHKNAKNIIDPAHLQYTTAIVAWLRDKLEEIHHTRGMTPERVKKSISAIEAKVAKKVKKDAKTKVIKLWLDEIPVDAFNSVYKDYQAYKSGAKKVRDGIIEPARHNAETKIVEARSEYEDAILKADTDRKNGLIQCEKDAKNGRIGLSMADAAKEMKALKEAASQTPGIAVKVVLDRKWERFKAGASKKLTPIVAKILHFIFVSFIGNLLKLIFYPVIALFKYIISKMMAKRGEKLAEKLVESTRKFLNTELSLEAANSFAAQINQGRKTQPPLKA